LASNERQEDVALRNGSLDFCGKISTQPDAADVHEDIVVAEGISEMIVKATSVTARILSAIANENAPHRSILQYTRTRS
jgi:hypothetical protein